MKLRSKMLILFSLLILIPMNLLGMMTYQKFSNAIENGTRIFSDQIVDQVNQNINRHIKEMSRISLMPLYDQGVLNILRIHSEGLTRYTTSSEQMKIHMFLSSLTYDREEIKGIHIITNDFNLFSDLDYAGVQTRVTNNEEQKKWYQDTLKADGASTIIPSHKPSYYIGSSQNVFSIARVINDPQTNQKLGIIKIDVYQEFVEEIMSDINFYDNASVFVLDEENQLIYEKGPVLFNNENAFWLNERGSTGRTIRYEGNEYLTFFQDSQNLGIKTYVMIPENELLKSAKELRTTTIILILIFIIMAIFLAVVFSNYLLQPIEQLRQKMVKAEKGNFEQKVNVKTNDEIGQLADGFNQMMDKINQLIKQVYETELREKEAELNALQSQINPHFIYNTLESINMMAITKGNFEVSDMVSSLGKLLRYTTDKHNRLITLDEEVKFVSSYIQIQQLRFGNRVKLKLNIDPDCSQALIPKLLLQPLVENAIIHGLEDGDREGEIQLSAKIENDNLYVIVSDNGIGITDSRMDQIKVEMEVVPSKEIMRLNKSRKGIAIKNINERIQLLFGAQYGMEIESELSKGTSVSLKLPHQVEGYYVQSSIS